MKQVLSKTSVIMSGYISDTPETNITEVPTTPDISLRCDRCKIYINLRSLREHRIYHDALEVMKYQGKNKPTSVDGLRKRRQIIIRKLREEKETRKQLQAIQEINDAYEYLKAEVQVPMIFIQVKFTNCAFSDKRSLWKWYVFCRPSL